MEFELAIRSLIRHVMLAYTCLHVEQVNREQTYSDWMTGEHELADVRRPAAGFPLILVRSRIEAAACANLAPAAEYTGCGHPGSA